MAAEETRGGELMAGSPAVRMRGWVFLCIGVFLIGLMSVVSYNVVPLLLHPGVTINGSRFDGSPLRPTKERPGQHDHAPLTTRST